MMIALLTITLEALVYKAVKQRPTVVTEGGAAIGVHLEPMLVGRLSTDMIKLINRNNFTQFLPINVLWGWGGL